VGEGVLLTVDVSAIHCYPLKPKRFEEALFPTTSPKRAVAEHLLAAPWLHRASEVQKRAGQVAHILEEPIELRKSCGQMELIWGSTRSECTRRRELVIEVPNRWQEVGGW
jgi:hypothetical protein